VIVANYSFSGVEGFKPNRHIVEFCVWGTSSWSYASYT